MNVIQNDLNYVISNPDMIFYFEDAIPIDVFQNIHQYPFKELKWGTHNFKNGFDFQKTPGWYRYYDYADTGDEPDWVTKLRDIALDKFSKVNDNIITSHSCRKSYMIMSDTGYHSCQHEIHQDFAEMGGKWSFLYHLIGTEGPTEFYSSFLDKKLIKSIPFKPGNLIIFPGIYPHKGDPKFNDLRITIDYLMDINCSANRNILDKSNALKKKYQQHFE